MILLGMTIVGAIFLVFGWAVTTEMFQHRAWRRKVASGDVDIIAALLEESLGTWRRGRPPRGTPANLWAGIQGAQLIAVEVDGATFSTSAEGEFRTEGGQRVQVASALDEGIAISAKLLDMILYDVPNLRLGYARVDVYSTFTGEQGAEQRPILSVTAERVIADEMVWEALTPEEIIGRFESAFERGPGGQPKPIVLPPVQGVPPRPSEEAAAEFAASEGRGKE